MLKLMHFVKIMINVVEITRYMFFLFHQLNFHLCFCFVPRRNETVLYLVSSIFEHVVQSFSSTLAEMSIIHSESSNEMAIPGIRRFLKAWPVTGNL